MQNHFTITDFMKQFRHEQIAYPGHERKPYANFFFRQFTGSRKETDIIGFCLVDKMSDKKVMVRLLEKLREKDLPDLTSLISLMQGLQKRLSFYAKKEPNTSQYYQQLLPALAQGTELINSFHEQIRNDLVYRLKLQLCNLPAQEDQQFFNSSELDVILEATERFSGELKKCFSHFNGLVQQESADQHRISVASEIHPYYLQLVNLIGRVIIDAAITSSRLVKWQVKLMNRETQELYN